jgi:flagellar hook protein FlgE
MLDTIFIGMSGLQGFSQGLKVISNNVTNLNTPGFKGASQQFTDAFYQFSNLPGQDRPLHGTGLTALSTRLNLQAGDTRHTGNALDLSIDGEGFFILRDPHTGQQVYSRAGQFQFNDDGELVSSTSGKLVMGHTESGLAGISMDALRTHAARATSRVRFMGNLQSTAETFDLNTVQLTDSLGAEHTVRLHFARGSGETANTWTVTVFDGEDSIGTGEIEFDDGEPVPEHSTVVFTYTPESGADFEVTLDFSSDVTSFAGSSTSTLAFQSQDGFASGTFTTASFDADGTLSLSYSNGQTQKGPQLALASFDFGLGLQQAGQGELRATGTHEPRIGRPGDGGLGNVKGEQLELSNVDLSSEFSELIVMQRGYQASSHVLNTADEMIRQLFDLKGGR